jgi:hypothetical protein
MVKSHNILTVPNNEEGKEFMKQFKKFFNRKTYSLQVRGRHANRTAIMRMAGKRMNSCRDITVGLADRHAVYIALKSRWDKNENT